MMETCPEIQTIDFLGAQLGRTFLAISIDIIVFTAGIYLLMSGSRALTQLIQRGGHLHGGRHKASLPRGQVPTTTNPLGDRTRETHDLLILESVAYIIDSAIKIAVELQLGLLRVENHPLLLLPLLPYEGVKQLIVDLHGSIALAHVKGIVVV